MTVFAVTPASVTVIGSNNTAKSALLPPLMVQVVSLIAPVMFIIPPAAVAVTADAEPEKKAAETNAVISVFFNMVNSGKNKIPD